MSATGMPITSSTMPSTPRSPMRISRPRLTGPPGTRGRRPASRGMEDRVPTAMIYSFIRSPDGSVDDERLHVEDRHRQVVVLAEGGECVRPGAVVDVHRPVGL